jgi:CRP/FNR family transcriptional regulator
LQNKLENKDLKNIFLFSELSDEELDEIRSFSHLKKFNKGEILFFDTEPYSGFYGLLDGAVKLYKISKEGKEHIIHIIFPFNTFAEVPLFENYDEIEKNNLTYPVNAMAIEDNTDVIVIPARNLLNFFSNNSKLYLKLLSTLSKRLRTLNSHIENLTLLDVKKRLAKYLLEEFDNAKLEKKKIEKKKGIILKEINFIELSISKNDLASHLGTILETLSRTFKKLQDDSIIEVESKKITILDLGKLKEMAK